ncbi:MAG: 5'-methylthioadenosine/S-adenosylhomocysteine nucleosidase [Chloroflexi bacterium]|nr:5'-methylthioadenosine/S-adenosylhomocysteine nucleosidase [Chloroflexota bacterium]
MTIGQFVRRLRGLTRTSIKTISAFDGRSNVTPAQLWRLENETTRLPDKPILDHLEEYFKLPPNFLYQLHNANNLTDDDHQQDSWDAEAFENQLKDADRLLIFKLILGEEPLSEVEARRLVELLVGKSTGRGGKPSTKLKRLVRIGVAGAVKLELDGLRERLKLGEWRDESGIQVASGEAENAVVIAARGGIGRVAAESVVSKLILDYKVNVIITLGFAGGTDSRVRAGHLVISKRLIPHHDLVSDVEPGPESMVIDCAEHLATLASSIARDMDIPHHEGVTVTVENIIDDPTEKAYLGENYGSLSVDMESYWIAKTCNQFKVSFVSVRSISDEVGDWMPNAVEFLDSSGSVVPSKALKYLAQHPEKIPDLMKLGGHMRRASQSLTRFGAAFVRKYDESYLKLESKIADDGLEELGEAN